MVEFAVVLPLLVVLLFGIIEFAWLFTQNLDVRHGAREGARLIAVNYPHGPVLPAPATRDSDQTDEIVAEICRRMHTANNARVTLTSNGDVGDPAVATVVADVQSLTGLFGWVVPATMTLSSTVEIRLEQPAGWADTTGGQNCP